MPRPYKCRRVFSEPSIQYFKPVGIMMRELDEVILTRDEFEAVRLADYEGKYQEEAAKLMNISRQTFGNIINSAHKKIADFLINTRALKIFGGVIEMISTDKRHFICYECKHKWAVPFGTAKPGKCPSCGSNNIHRSPDERGGFNRGRNRQSQRRGFCVNQ